MFEGVNEKLKRAEYFLNNLKALADEAGGFAHIKKQQEMRANLDGFFFEVISAKDFFLQGINDVYGLGLKKNSATDIGQLKCQLGLIYLRRTDSDAKSLSNALKAAEAIEGLISRKNSWLWIINTYRNSATHRELLHFGHVVIPRENIKTYLFKDPEDGLQGNADIEVIPYCEQSLAQMKELLERLYSELELE
ncbi:MAG TPA: hypothetical protein VMW60_03530 [Dehalococcoidales bacterium]|nr:hypothetical protein [Dehalococcoidales bacterium]